MFNAPQNLSNEWPNSSQIRPGTESRNGLLRGASGIPFPSPHMTQSARHNGSNSDCVLPRPQPFRGSNPAFFNNNSHNQLQTFSQSQSYTNHSYGPSYYPYVQSTAHHYSSYNYDQMFSYSHQSPAYTDYPHNSTTSYSYYPQQPTPSFQNSPYQYDPYSQQNGYQYYNGVTCSADGYNYRDNPTPTTHTVSDSFVPKPSEPSAVETRSPRTKTSEASDDELDLDNIVEVDFAKEFPSSEYAKSNSSSSTTAVDPRTQARNEQSGSVLKNPEKVVPNLPAASQTQISVPEPSLPLGAVNVGAPCSVESNAKSSAIFSLALKNRGLKRKRPLIETHEQELSQLLCKSKHRVSSQSYAAKPSTGKQNESSKESSASGASSVTSDVDKSSESGFQTGSNSSSRNINFRDKSRCEKSDQQQQRSKIMHLLDQVHLPPSKNQNNSSPDLSLSKKGNACSETSQMEEDIPVYDIRIRTDIFEDEVDDDIVQTKDDEDEELEVT